jgi:glutathione S-transferase
MSEPETSPGIMQVYGSRISYYTGKLETYLRYRRIPYELKPTVGNEKKLLAGAGVVQMPVVQLTDGRWMTDSTPMIAWLDAGQSAPGIFPADPVLNFAALLIEDYADEWLWRPAMHYRWSYRPDRQHAAETLYTELIKGTLPIPRFIALNRLKTRQRGGFVSGDGVNSKSRAHADQTYLNALDRLQAILEIRPFILGNTPTLADFGMMGPMLRHFGQDPTPAEIMRNRAPAVYEWVARMWNLQPADGAPDLIASVDPCLARFLAEACETNLAQHRQNAAAFGRGEARYDLTVQGACYEGVPVSRYRVWCLEQLRRIWSGLTAEVQTALKAQLTSPEAAILWDSTPIKPSEYDVANAAPFNKAINVFGTGVPAR